MKKKNQGITLIELMIVVAIVGILASIAWPSYQGSVQRGFRAEALTEMSDIRWGQEDFHGKAKRYTNDFKDLGMSNVSTSKILVANGRYEIELTSDDTSFSITATPKNAQVDDPCNQITLDSLGQKKVVGAKISADKCWSD